MGRAQTRHWVAEDHLVPLADLHRISHRFDAAAAPADGVAADVAGVAVDVAPSCDPFRASPVSQRSQAHRATSAACHPK